MKKLKPHVKLFIKNEKGEYWQAVCMICCNAVFSFKVDDIHILWDDNNYSGRPICIDCFEELIVKIPIKIDRQIKRKKRLKKGLEKWLK